MLGQKVLCLLKKFRANTVNLDRVVPIKKSEVLLVPLYQG